MVNKRGSWTTVIIFLVIFLFIVATVIILSIVNKNAENIEEMPLDKLNLDLRIEEVQVMNEKTIGIKVRIDSGEGEISGVNFLIDNGRQFEIIQRGISLDELEGKEFILNLKRVEIDKNTKILVSPIFQLESGKTATGTVRETYEISEEELNFQENSKIKYSEDNASNIETNNTEEICRDNCSSLNYQCGIRTICGINLNCGSCLEGYNCLNNGSCSKIVCLENCSSKGYGCGNRTICGVSTNCGSCSTGHTCQTNGTCIKDCTESCSSLNYNCGTHPICSLDVYCGSCSTGHTCQTNGTCMKSCTAETNSAFCSRLGKNCGRVTADDNCGNSRTISSCGSCSTGHTCQTNGTCMKSCTPSCSGKECGSDGCTGTCSPGCSALHGTNTCSSSGICQPSCSSGYGNCDGNNNNGCETYLLNSVSNCGSCGTTCTNAHGSTYCVTGNCQPSCSSGYGNCDGNNNNGCETYLLNSVSNCGSCGNVCSSGYTCTNNVCTPPPQTCTGSPTQSCSITNGVGSQSRTCNSGTWSSWGTCTVQSCNTNYVQSGNTCVPSSPPPTTGAIIIDHTKTNINSISSSCISTIKNNLRVAYSHTSHGNQIIEGMDMLMDYSSTYTYGSSGLHFEDYYGYSDDDGFGTGGCYDLSNCDGSGIIDPTTEFLDSSRGQGINVIMWSWCSIAWHDIPGYLDAMQTLIEDYSNVHFVFMTGHTDGTGPGEEVDNNNNMIRNFVKNNAFCKTHECILFDFADMEEYSPTGTIDYMTKDVNMDLSYDGGNWGDDYLSSHSDIYTQLTARQKSEGCSHSDTSSGAYMNCVVKGGATWYMLGKIAGCA
ncbi:MAG: hypothetical protein ABIE36_01380 [Candidatus Diapherotrites archaeon]